MDQDEVLARLAELSEPEPTSTSAVDVLARLKSFEDVDPDPEPDADTDPALDSVEESPEPEIVPEPRRDEKAIDETAWDGAQAMSECDTAAEYGRICALDRGSDVTALTARFGLPHHYLSQAPTPNAAGVAAARNALAGGRTGTPMSGTGIPEARAHLEAHAAQIEAARTAAAPAPEAKSVTVTVTIPDWHDDPKPVAMKKLVLRDEATGRIEEIREVPVDADE